LPSVTWPSPPRATEPLMRTARIVVTLGMVTGCTPLCKGSHPRASLAGPERICHSTPMRGRFIVVEGIDGSAKSTVATRIVDELTRRGRKVLRTREPGGTPLSEKIRALLLDAKHSEMVPFTELFLYMASRAQLVDEVIRPSLRDGVDVVCDRYYYSTAAYQGAAGRVGIPVV